MLVTEPRAAPRTGASAPGPAIGVLALQGDVAEHLAALRAAGARPVPVRRPGELDGVDGLVIPGGESTTMWKLAVIFDLMEPLRKRIGSGMPAFGSCAGMIMLADRLADGIDGQETFGGIGLTVRRNPFGRQADSFQAGTPTLYDAIQKAKKSSVPNETIDRAVRRGAGLEAGGATYETVTYEGYAPGGVAVLVQTLTDNRNRAAADVRTALTRNGGSMADPGSVSYLFNRKGVVIVDKAAGVTEDDVVAAVLDAGAEEVNDLGESFDVVSAATDLVAVRAALQQAGIDYESADAAFLPSVEVPLDEEQAKRGFRLIEAIEDSDDVQDVYANYSVSDEVMEKLG